jgi:hypothetical protein
MRNEVPMDAQMTHHSGGEPPLSPLERALVATLVSAIVKELRDEMQRPAA